VAQRAVLVAPLFDEATKYSFMWAQRLRSALEQMGWRIVEVGGREVSREEVEELLDKSPCAAFIFYDHGTEDALWGSEEEEVVDLKNVGKLANRVVYTMACLSAKRLGAVAHLKHGAVYVGYVEEFAFTEYDEHLFCECANSGMIAYARGEEDWARIKEAMLRAFDEAIEKARDPWTKVLLRWDKEALRVYALGADRPEAECPLRKAAVALFGARLGHSITRLEALGWAMALIGYGIALHDFAHQVWELKGTVLSLEGGYVGFALLALGIALALLAGHEG